MMFVPLLMLVSILDGVYSTNDPYTYVGCHKDDRDKRDLPNNFRRGNPGNPMTRETCNAHCHGYLFFGLQHGDECWCGMSYGRYNDRWGNGCDDPCQTDPDIMCGGGLRNSVYRRHSSSVASYNTLTYVGCYEDKDPNRHLEHIMPRNYTDMTIEWCNELCQSYKYFGVESADECYCGDNDERRYGWRSDCDQDCTGDQTQKCGGSWRISVYRTGLLQ